MSNEDDDFYGDVPDAMWTRLPVVDPGVVGRRLFRSLQRRTENRASYMGQFREATGSESFRARARAEDVRSHSMKYFKDRHRMRYLKAMRSGMGSGTPEGGGVSLFAQHNEDGSERRRLVVKYHMDEGRGANEVKWLERFAGVDHVVNLVQLGEEVQDASPGAATSSSNAAATNPPNITAASLHPQWTDPEYAGNHIGVQEMVVRSRIPMMVLEYLPGGDLSDVRQRCRDQGVTPPERFLWAVLLCLMRACTGMEFNKSMVAGEKDEIPDDDIELNVLHGNLDLTQVLVGPIIADGEHDLMPMFKLCGFSSTKNSEMAMEENLQEIGKIIQTLAVPRSDAIDEATGLLKEDNINFRNEDDVEMLTWAHEDFIDAPEISFAFTWLVVRLLAQDILDVPPMPILLDWADARLQHWSTIKKIKVKANRHDNIKEFVQNVVLNAPLVQPQVETPEPGQWDVIKDKIPSIVDSTLEMLKKVVISEPPRGGPAPP